jgi:hypothetical protein
MQTLNVGKYYLIVTQNASAQPTVTDLLKALSYGARKQRC